MNRTEEFLGARWRSPGRIRLVLLKVHKSGIIGQTWVPCVPEIVCEIHERAPGRGRASLWMDKVEGTWYIRIGEW